MRAPIALLLLFVCSLNFGVELALAAEDDGHDDHGTDDHGAGHDDHGTGHDDHGTGHDDHGDDHGAGADDHGDHGAGHDDHDDHEEEHEEHKRWGLVIGGSLITMAPATFGVVLLPITQQCGGGKMPKFMLAFGSGTILAAAAFLLLPEALHLTGEDADEEVDGTWPWGTAVLAGWFFGMVLHHFLHLVFTLGFGHKNRDKSAQVPKDSSSSSAGAASVMTNDSVVVCGRTVNLAVIGAVFFGDMMHNLVDGIAIGVAAKGCSTTMVWTLIWSTFAHETPQEIADQAALEEKGKLKWYEAVAVNVVSSLSTVVAAIIAHSADISAMAEGLFLAFGGGVYLFVALTEMGTEAVHLDAGSPKASLLQATSCVLAYAVGAVAIGLVLLEHEHCSAGGHAHAH